MANQTPTLLTFMTKVDEAKFSQALVSTLPEITFLNIGDWPTKKPLTKNTLGDCSSDSPQHSIWNKAILPTTDYIENFIFHNETNNAYFGATIGPGLIQYIRPSIADYDNLSLRNGRLSSSYDPKTDPQTHYFVKETFRILRTGARRVYLVDRKTGQTDDKPELHFFAWPDVAEKYNGDNGKYLTNNFLTYFVATPRKKS